MMLRTALLSLLAAATASANQILVGDAPMDGVLAEKLLSKATVVEASRYLEQNQERDAAFVAMYKIKYLGCSSLIQINREGNQEDGLLYSQQLIRFALCPNSCTSCSGGGEYVVDMLQFIDAYTEAKMEEQEWQCEMVRETCYCDNANDDQVCENQCYYDAGMDYCVEIEGEDGFEIQRYLECAEMENNGNNNNNNNNANYYYNGNNANNGQYYGSLYIGPYCSTQDSKSIYMGVFYDQGCTARADSSLYATRSYGRELPYSKESIIEKNECISCLKVENNNNNNNGNNNNGNNNYNYNNGQDNYYYYNNGDAEASELCTNSYEMAAKCETNMDVSYPDTTGCDYINNVLPKLDAASKSVMTGSTGRNAGAALAVMFALTTVLFGAYAYFLYRKIKRGSSGAALIQGNEASMS